MLSAAMLYMPDGIIRSSIRACALLRIKHKGIKKKKNAGHVGKRSKSLLLRDFGYLKCYIHTKTTENKGIYEERFFMTKLYC